MGAESVDSGVNGQGLCSPCGMVWKWEEVTLLGKVMGTATARTGYAQDAGCLRWLVHVGAFCMG